MHQSLYSYSQELFYQLRMVFLINLALSIEVLRFGSTANAPHFDYDSSLENSQR